jgi:hypothetical protein
VCTTPVGFETPLKMTIRAAGVRSHAARRTSGVSLRPRSSVHAIGTGRPPAARTMSGYESHDGCGTRTGSPSFTIAWIAWKIACLAPVLTITCGGAYRRFHGFS